MAKWIKSTTQKTYTIAGKFVPAAVTKDNKYLNMSDSEYAKFLENKVVSSLVNAGALFVTDKEPSTPTQQVSTLTGRVASMTLENTKLQEKVADLEKQLEAAGSGASAKVIKAAVAKQKAEDEAAIEKIVADKDKRIAELEAMLSEQQK